MEEGELLGSGKLKIFFSYAPGTGKTRTMLTADRGRTETGRGCCRWISGEIL